MPQRNFDPHRKSFPTLASLEVTRHRKAILDARFKSGKRMGPPEYAVSICLPQVAFSCKLDGPFDDPAQAEKALERIQLEFTSQGVQFLP